MKKLLMLSLIIVGLCGCDAMDALKATKNMDNKMDQMNDKMSEMNSGMQKT